MLYDNEEDTIAQCMADEGQYAVQHAVALPGRPAGDNPLVGVERGIHYLIMGFTQWIRRS